MQTISRRKYLATTAVSVAGLGGCLGDGDDDGNSTDGGAVDPETPTETPGKESEVAALEREVEDLESQLREAEERADEAENTVSELRRQLVAEKYIYAYSLATAGDEQYRTAVGHWEGQSWTEAQTKANQSLGIYTAAEAAGEDVSGAIEDSDVDWSGDPAAAADSLTEYASLMSDACAALAEAGRAAAQEDYSTAEDSRDNATSFVNQARELDLLAASAFREEL